jgi:farnesyl-diphosphate farnesyltransferase
MAELNDYTYRVAGCVGEFWTKLCRAHLFPGAALDEDQLVADGVQLGRGLQLVNILRDLPADLSNGRCYLPREILGPAGLAPEALLAPEKAETFLPLFHAQLDLAEAHLRTGWRYTNTLPFGQFRVRLACAWPILLGLETIRKLRGASLADLQRRVKVSRGEVYGIIFRSIVACPAPFLWRRLYVASRS